MVVPDKTIKEVSGHDGALRVRSDDDRVCFVEIGNPFRVGVEVDIKPSGMRFSIVPSPSNGIFAILPNLTLRSFSNLHSACSVVLANFELVPVAPAKSIMRFWKVTSDGGTHYPETTPEYL